MHLVYLRSPNDDLFPWCEPGSPDDEVYDFEAHRDDTARFGRADIWWMDTPVPGFTCTWKDLNRVSLHKLQQIRPNLFFLHGLPMSQLQSLSMNRRLTNAINLAYSYKCVSSFHTYLILMDPSP